MTARPKILIVGQPGEREQQMLALLRDHFDVAEARSMIRALARLSRGEFAGVYVASEQMTDAFPVGKLLQSERLIERLPCGVVLLDHDNTIVWANGRLREWCRPECAAPTEMIGVDQDHDRRGAGTRRRPDVQDLSAAFAASTAASSTSTAARSNASAACHTRSTSA